MLAKTMKVNTITDPLELSLLRSVILVATQRFCIQSAFHPQSTLSRYFTSMQYAVRNPHSVFYKDSLVP